jgi:hypothetical protein
MTVPHLFGMLACGTGDLPPIEFVDAGTPVQKESNLTMSIPIPTHASGDLLILLLVGDDDLSVNLDADGWNQHLLLQFGGSPSDFFVAWEVGDGVISSLDVDCGNQAHGVIVAYRYVDTTTPFDVTATTADAGPTTTLAAPAIVPVTDGAMLLRLYSWRGAGTLSLTTADGHTTRVNSPYGVGEDRALALFEKYQTTAASDSGASATITVSSFIQCISMALRPG